MAISDDKAQISSPKKLSKQDKVFTYQPLLDLVETSHV